MKPGDRVQVKRGVEYQGRIGEVLVVDGVGDRTVEVEFEDEAVTHWFSVQELEKIER
jgi:hypothetical protein